MAEQPELVNDGDPQHVRRLRKALCGLKQAGRQWHFLKDVMKSLNFSPTGDDPALFIQHDNDAFVLLRVDDLFLIGSSTACDKFTTAAVKHFDSREPVCVSPRWRPQAGLGCLQTRSLNALWWVLVFFRLSLSSFTGDGPARAFISPK